MIGHWFARRIDTAMAVYSVGLSVGFMLAFPAVGAAIQAWAGARPGPSSGRRSSLDSPRSPRSSSVLVRRPSVWRSTATCRVTTALSRPPHPRPPCVRTPPRTPTAGRRPWAAVPFGSSRSTRRSTGSWRRGSDCSNESILAERGFGADIYYRTLAVTAITALAGNFLGGWLAGRVRLTHLLGVSLALLGAGVGALPFLHTVAHVMAWAVAMGLGGGIVMVLFFSVWPRVFGRRHLGRIQGLAQALTVVGSAIGPLLLAACVSWTGSYGPMFEILAAVVLAAAVAGVVVPLPPPATFTVHAPQSAAGGS